MGRILLLCFLALSCNERSISYNESSISGKWSLRKIFYYSDHDQKFDTLDLFDSIKSVTKIFTSQFKYSMDKIAEFDTNGLKKFASFLYGLKKEVGFELRGDHRFFCRRNGFEFLSIIPKYSTTTQNDSISGIWNYYIDTLEFSSPDPRLKRSAFYRVVNLKKDTLWLANIEANRHVKSDQYVFVRQ